VLSENQVDESPTFQTCAIRPSGIIGVGDFVVLPGVLEAYYRGQTKFQLGSNRNLFDFTDNTNVAHAHCLAAVKLHEQRKMKKLPGPDMRVDGEVFIVTNDEPHFFWDFTRRVWQIAGDKTRPDEIVTIPRFPAMVIATTLEWVWWAIGLGEPPLSRTKVRLSCMTRYFRIDKAKKRLGYAPLISLDDALTRGVEDCKRRHNLESEVLGSVIRSKKT
jgi:sterol-4alpha-carboxylate 3-dehydrogenase (decarboxylating)